MLPNAAQTAQNSRKNNFNIKEVDQTTHTEVALTSHKHTDTHTDTSVGFI